MFSLLLHNFNDMAVHHEKHSYPLKTSTCRNMSFILFAHDLLSIYLCVFKDSSVQKVGGGRKKTVSFSSMPSEKKVD